MVQEPVQGQRKVRVDAPGRGLLTNKFPSKWTDWEWFQLHLIAGLARNPTASRSESPLIGCAVFLRSSG